MPGGMEEYMLMNHVRYKPARFRAGALMEDSPIQSIRPALKKFGPYIAAIAIGGTGIGYAVHEHNAAQDLATKNAQVTATLQSTQSQLGDLTAKVNALASQNNTAPAPAAGPNATAGPDQSAGSAPSGGTASTGASAPGTAKKSAAVPHNRATDRRFTKLQSQLDAQAKAIEDNKNDLASTRGDLANTRTELNGSIARTHDELVLLEKKGERNYYEFDIQKSKQFQREGPLGIRLKKVSNKHGFADLELMVEDRNLSQKHVNIFQPVMFYQSDSPQPIEIVINDISKDHIHGYVSAPKYRKSELVAASNAAAGNPAQGASQPASTDATHRKITVSQ